MKWRLRRLATALLLPLALAAIGGVWFLAQVAAEPEEPLRPTDAIVVLTGGAERVETGLSLLEEGAAPRLLISGVAPRLGLAELARTHGRDAAALEGRVTLGHVATTTRGNAMEIAAWVRAQPRPVASLRVVTAGYHMPRATLELRRALPGVELVPHPVGPSVLRDGVMPLPRVARLLAGEYVKYGGALLGLAALVPAREAGQR